MMIKTSRIYFLIFLVFSLLGCTFNEPRAKQRPPLVDVALADVPTGVLRYPVAMTASPTTYEVPFKIDKTGRHWFSGLFVYKNAKELPGYFETVYTFDKKNPGSVKSVKSFTYSTPESFSGRVEIINLDGDVLLSSDVNVHNTRRKISFVAGSSDLNRILVLRLIDFKISPEAAKYENVTRFSIIKRRKIRRLRELTY